MAQCTLYFTGRDGEWPKTLTGPRINGRVATKIFEGFEEALFMEFIKGREPVSNVHYTRPGTCINRPLHQAWIQYQAGHPKLFSYPTPCKLACHLPRKQLQNHGSSISGPPENSSKNLRCNSGQGHAVDRNISRSHSYANKSKHQLHNNQAPINPTSDWDTSWSHRSNWIWFIQRFIFVLKVCLYITTQERNHTML